jgi:hypothetical protein
MKTIIFTISILFSLGLFAEITKTDFANITELDHPGLNVIAGLSKKSFAQIKDPSFCSDIFKVKFSEMAATEAVDHETLVRKSLYFAKENGSTPKRVYVESQGFVNANDSTLILAHVWKDTHDLAIDLSTDNVALESVIKKYPTFEKMRLAYGMYYTSVSKVYFVSIINVEAGEILHIGTGYCD